MRESVRVTVCTLGDLLLDVIVRLHGQLADDADSVGETRVGAGGQAANVAAWAASLGADARFFGALGRDGAGQLVAAELKARGVRILGPELEGRNGVVVSLVDDEGRRTMISDRGVAPLLRPDDLDVGWLRGCDWLHVTGYSLFRGPIDEAAAKAAGAVQAQGGRVSVDLSSWTAIRDFGADDFRRRLAELRPDVVFGNERERETLGDLSGPVWIVKLGPRGFRVENGAESEAHPATGGPVVDTTGAGDALAAGFLVGGPKLAAEAAGRCIAKLGAMP